MKIGFFTCTITFSKTIAVNATMAIFLLLFTHSTGFGQVYSYTDVSEGSSSVIGYGSVTGYYNGSTHIYNTRVTISAPSGRSTTLYGSGSSGTTSLSFDDEHGLFGVSTTHEGTCPGSGSNHAVGGSGGSMTLPKRCSLGSASFTGSATTTNLAVSVSCSKDNANPGTTAVTVGAVAVEPAGGWALMAIPDQNITVTDGSSQSLSFSFIRDVGTPLTSCACTCKGEAVLSSATGATITPPGSARTMGSITIQ